MKVNVLGFGVMGRQMAALFQILGYDVRVWTRRLEEDRKKMHERDLRLLRRRLPEIRPLGTVTMVERPDVLEAAVTMEVLVEDLDVKRRALSQLPYGFENMDLFTNTSSYSPGEVHPNARGFHFLNPVYALRFAEITGDPQSLKEEGRRLMEDVQALGFELIRSHDNRGYIGNFILFREIAAALRIIDLYGYRTDAVDRVLSHMGRSASLFDIIDLVGVDVTRTILANLREVDPTVYVSAILDRALERNILGRKNGTSIRSVIDA